MQIFISHSSSDKSYGSALIELLLKLGVDPNSIVFTSDRNYGIPAGKNIFDWLKSKMQDGPIVLYLLSKDYYRKPACVCEMGAAWMVEAAQLPLFLPGFTPDDFEFKSGALDPRTLGVHIDIEDEVHSLVDRINELLHLTPRGGLVAKSVVKFVNDVTEIANLIAISADDLGSSEDVKSENVYGRFLAYIRSEKVESVDLLLLKYVLDNASHVLGWRWQEDIEIANILKWERAKNIKPILSERYRYVIQKFNALLFLVHNDSTSYGNTRSYIFNQDIVASLYDLPDDVIVIIDNSLLASHFLEPPSAISKDAETNNPTF